MYYRKIVIIINIPSIFFYHIHFSMADLYQPCLSSIHCELLVCLSHEYFEICAFIVNPRHTVYTRKKDVQPPFKIYQNSSKW